MSKVGEKVIELKEASCDIIIEKPFFSQDENGYFKFVDGKEKDFDLYHSEDEFSFAETLDFLKEFSDKKFSLIETAYIKVNVMLDKAKEFLGLKEEEKDPNLQDILFKLQSKKNQEKYSKVIKNIDDLSKCAGNLNFWFNKKITSTAHASLMKISTKIKEAYFNFQEKIKETLTLISVYKKRSLSEVIKYKENGNEKSLSQSELRDYQLFCVYVLTLCRTCKATRYFMTKIKDYTMFMLRH